MKLLFKSITILFAVHFCNYNGTYQKVIWINQDKKFKTQLSQLGLFGISSEIRDCKIKKKKLSINGMIYDEDNSYYNENKPLKNSMVILSCDKNLKIIDTLFTSKKEGHFTIEVPFIKENCLIIKGVDKMDGYKYNLKDFR